MSSREPLWYCHECHAEMRPLMTPDPICASCHGGFIEKLENTQDDPRQFIQANDEPNGPDQVPGLDNLLFSLHHLLDRGMSSRARPDGSSSGPRLVLQYNSTNGTRPVTVGGPPTVNPRGNESRRTTGDTGPPVPTMTEFLQGEPGTPDLGGPRIAPHVMAQYLLALLENRDPLTALLRGAGSENGRMGDYVFNQEALDEVLTQLMENSNAHRPVPATEEIMNKLPREVLTVESTTLRQDCAVCKDHFKLETEDPDEQIVVTLPCKHPFHQPCIIPWLKSSGTCPVCRFALIPQPNQQTPAQPQSSTSPLNSPARTRPPPSSQPPPAREQELTHGVSGGGFLHSIINHLTGSPSNNRRSPPPRTSTGSPSRASAHRTSSSDSYPSSSEGRRRRNERDHLPGGWQDDLD